MPDIIELLDFEHLEVLECGFERVEIGNLNIRIAIGAREIL